MQVRFDEKEECLCPASNDTLTIWFDQKGQSDMMGSTYDIVLPALFMAAFCA